MEEEAKSTTFCGFLVLDSPQNPFFRCIATLSPKVTKAISDDCIYDFCANDPDKEDQKQAACEALAHFAAKCEDIGIIVNWRDITNCGEQ